MSANSRIEFCHETLNPIVGCSPVSPGCRNCFAVRMARRHEGNMATPQYHGLTRYVETGGHPAHGGGGRIEWTGEVRWVPGVLEKAMSRLSKARKPRRIFMVSMGDLFHGRVPGIWRQGVFDFMCDLPMHRFIVITKRAERMADGVLASIPKPLPNVMLMATTENQEQAERRIPHLLRMAAKGWHTGVIVEPMLENMTLTRLDFKFPGENIRTNALTGERLLRLGFADPLPACLEWVVCGAEQGHGKRIIPLQYPGKLASQCANAGVPFFFKKNSDGLYAEALSRQFPAWMEV